MCVYSMVGDHYRDDIWKHRPWRVEPPAQPFPVMPPPPIVNPDAVTRAEFDELKKEVAQMIKLLKRAQEYDARTGQPHCEVEDKVDFLRKVAALVGVDLDAEMGKVGARDCQGECAEEGHDPVHVMGDEGPHPR